MYRTHNSISLRISIRMCTHKSVLIPYPKSKRIPFFVTEQIRSIVALIRSCYALLQILDTDTKETRYGYVSTCRGSQPPFIAYNIAQYIFPTTPFIASIKILGQYLVRANWSRSPQLWPFFRSCCTHTRRPSSRPPPSEGVDTSASAAQDPSTTAAAAPMGEAALPALSDSKELE